MPALDPLAEAWLGGLHRTPNTVRTYRGHIAHFSDWAAAQPLALLAVVDDDLSRYSLYVHQQGLSERTMSGRFIAVRAFYRWLYEEGRIASNPAARFSPRYSNKRVTTEVLSLSDLRSLLASTTDDRDRAVLLLMLVNGLGGRTISVLRVADLQRTDDGYLLRLPDGSGTPLPNLVALPLVAAVADRRRGLLLTNSRGRPLTRTNFKTLLARCGNAARLGVTVTAQLLLASMRDVLVTEPIPMTSVLQATGFGAYSNLTERARLQPAAAQHAAVKMALLLRPDAESTNAYFDHADGLTSHHGLPPAARVMLAGAAFERHLRELGISRGAIPADVAKTQLGSLLGQLVGARVISESDNQVCAVVVRVRDRAAHGWFEQVSSNDADQVVDIMRRMVADHPA